MSQFSIPHRISLVFNVIFWLFYFLYEWLGLAALSGEYGNYLINACMALPLAFIVSYVTVHVLIAKYYGKWPRWMFWTVQLLISLTLLFIRRTINYFIIYPKCFPFALEIPFFSFGKLIVEFVNLYLIVGVYSLFYFIKYWYEERQRVKDLIQQKTIAELELLKSQIHPHFIFNTLNNIYSSALKKSPETAKLVSYLSSFLSYTLYDSKQNFVQLSSEILHLKNYIELQRNRYSEKLDVSLNIYNDISGLVITPLLLLPLLENCFKHGIDNAMDQSWIRIDVSNDNDKFSIKIENSIDGEAETTRVNNGGIGIENVKKRLALIYPNKHEFTVIKETHTFLVVLKISTAK